MLRLRTFGSVYVTGEDGSPLSGAAAQRRLLALLALLAVAGEAGMSRDKILGVLWPDRDPESARHALTQSLYHARRTLACGDLFDSASDVRLNPERITSDVQELEAALAAGELEAAVALYQGPFLDGFFLSGSADFEQWVSVHQSRYARQIAAALGQLGEGAEGAGDTRQAVRWRRRLVAVDPLRADSVVKLMLALAADGDRAGALAQASTHEALLRSQLEVGADPAVAALAERLRDDEAWAGMRTVPELPAVVASASPAVSPATVTAAEPSPPAAVLARRSPMRRWWIAGAAVLASLLVGGVTLARRGAPATTLVAQPAGQSIVVAPFRVAGADPALSYVRSGIVELLSTRLTDDSVRAVDPGVVFNRWRATPGAGESDLSQGESVRIAATLGATDVVVGNVVGDPSRLVLSASLLTVPGGDVVAGVTVDGPLDSLPSLVDRLAARLLAGRAGQGERLAEYRLPRLPALRAFLDGQAAYRLGNTGEAVRHYERALREDSTFSLAALRLAIAADRLNEGEQHDRALALAWAARDALGEPDRAHLIAFAGPRYPAPSTEADQLAAWERAVSLTPDRAEVWHELGERFFHGGTVLGARDATDRAEAAFGRALELDPLLTAARRHLVLLAAREGDSTELDRIASPAALRDSMGDQAPFIRWRVALARGDHPELARTRAEFPGLSDVSLRAIAMASQYDAAGMDDGEEALRIRSARVRRTADRVDALLGQHSMALIRGRPAVAARIADQLLALQPGSNVHLRLRVLDALYGGGDRSAAGAAADALARRSAAPPSANPEVRAAQLADLCVLEQWRLAAGETRATPGAVAQLRESGLPTIPVLVGAGPLACAELLEAGWLVATRAADALPRVARLDSLVLGGPAASDAGTYAHILLARLYERLGEPVRALAAIRRRSYMTGWPRYLATARAEESRLAARVGGSGAAAAAP